MARQPKPAQPANAWTTEAVAALSTLFTSARLKGAELIGAAVKALPFKPSKDDVARVTDAAGPFKDLPEGSRNAIALACRVKALDPDLPVQAVRLTASETKDAIAARPLPLLKFLVAKMEEGDALDTAIGKARKNREFQATPEAVEAHNAAYALKKRMETVIVAWLDHPHPSMTVDRAVVDAAYLKLLSVLPAGPIEG